LLHIVASQKTHLILKNTKTTEVFVTNQHCWSIILLIKKYEDLYSAYPALSGGSRRWVCYPGNTADRQTQWALTYYHLPQSTANQNGKLIHCHRWDSNLWSSGC
jgi:hypothetical protein